MFFKTRQDELDEAAHRGYADKLRAPRGEILWYTTYNNDPEAQAQYRRGRGGYSPQYDRQDTSS